MKRSRRIFVGLCLSAFLVLPACLASAATVVWDVDPSVSYIRLTIPDQAINVPDVGNVTVKLRDANSDSQWTDAGGRRAVLDGSIVTDYENFTSVQFVSGSAGIVALEQTNLRPNEAQWNPATSTYNGTGTAPAALGARVRGTVVVIILPVTLDAAFMALRGVHMDISSTVLPLDGDGSFAAYGTTFGIASAVGDIDGLPFGSFGQPIPDLLAEPLPPTSAIDSSGGMIENIGGRNRKLTYNINVPMLSIQVDTITISGSAEGLIVAYGVIPDQGIPFDLDGDGDVDKQDFDVFKACVTGPSVVGLPAGCTPAQFAACDRDQDLDVDVVDFGKFQRCFSGTDKPARPDCDQ